VQGGQNGVDGGEVDRGDRRGEDDCGEKEVDGDLAGHGDVKDLARAVVVVRKERDEGEGDVHLRKVGRGRRDRSRSDARAGTARVRGLTWMQAKTVGKVMAEGAVLTLSQH
jgi:hypothetical protein